MKNRNKIQIFTIILLIVAINDILVYGGPAIGKDNPVENCEKIFIHLDKTVYVAGESLHYKVYVVNGQPPLQVPESKILYFELSEYKNEQQLSWRINLNKSTLHGSYQLPENMDAGVYKLAVYTNRIRENVPENIFSQELFILNLATETPDSIYIPVSKVQTDNQVSVVTMPDNQPGIRLSALKSEYRPNDKVILEIIVDNLQHNDTANLSLSVTNETPFSEIFHNANITEQFNRYKEINSTPCSNGLENYAYMLNGRVLNKNDGSPVKNAKILLAVVDTVSPKIMYSASDLKGNFRFYLNKVFDNKEIILQLVDSNESLNILWDIEKKSIPCNVGSNQLILLSTEQVALLNQVKDIRLIEAVYSEKIISKRTPETFPGASYFACPDKIIIPDDYAEMFNFKEITANILPSAKFINRNDNYFIQVFNRSKGAWCENNLVLLNGVPFSDLNYFATLGTRDIQRIEVINSGSFLAGGLIYDGVISIYTHEAKIPDTYLKNHAKVIQNIVAAIDGENEKKACVVPPRQGPHIPDFRSNLYWNPNLKTCGTNKITVEFTTSQLTGKFNINIEGITSLGTPLDASVSFNVK